jgi:hypothetical protein
MTRLIARISCWLVGSHDEYRFCDANRRTFGYVCAACGRKSVVTCDYNEPRVTQHGDQMRHVVFNGRLFPVKKRGTPVWLHGVHVRKGA